MTPNPGHCPPEAAGKRVRVKLRSGYAFEAIADQVSRGLKLDWRLTGSTADVIEWELVT
jgi:hypothetical protein